MSARKQFTDIDKKTREYIRERDKHCIICYSRYNLQIAHIFVSRAHGGKGCKENLVLLCSKCHSILDNPIGRIQNELSIEYDDFCKNYLIKKENIDNIENLYKNIKYNKSF